MTYIYTNAQGVTVTREITVPGYVSLTKASNAGRYPTVTLDAAYGALGIPFQRVELRGSGIREGVRECQRGQCGTSYDHRYCVSMRDLDPYLRAPLVSR